MTDPRAMRILRDRLGGFQADVDRLPSPASSGAARIALQVYNGGNMPTEPDHYFLGHPVTLSGAEIEGTQPSILADTTTSVPFVALHSAPAVGDVLVATLVGNRWVAEKGTSGTTICVVACYPALHVFGALVQIYTAPGGTLLASCTTPASGCCSFSLSGSYYVTVTVSDKLAYADTITLAGSVTIPLSGTSGLVCCGGYLIPEILTLTDAAGSLQFVYYPNYFYPIWYGGHAVNLVSCSVTTPNNICVAAAPILGPVRVCYQMTCVTGSSPAFSVQRSWSWVYQQGTLTPIWYQDGTGFAAGQPCVTSPPGSCGSPHTDTSSFAATPSSGSPFTLAGSPAAAVGNATTDPVGGTIVISA